MKTINLILRAVLFIAIILTCGNTYAQRGVPAPYRADYNRMMSNNTKMLMNQNARFAQSMLAYQYRYDPNYVDNEEYTFSVAFKDGSIRIVESRIYSDTTNRSCYLLLIDRNLPKKEPAREQKIFAKETLNISRKTEQGEDITGIANDTCWQFKVLSGKINAYSYLSETEGIDSFYLSAFQVGDGPIQNLTPEALEPVIKADDKAHLAFLNKNYYNAIKRYNKDHK